MFANSGDPDQTRLIWICTICLYPFYGTPGMNKTTEKHFSRQNMHFVDFVLVFHEGLICFWRLYCLLIGNQSLIVLFVMSKLTCVIFIGVVILWKFNIAVSTKGMHYYCSLCGPGLLHALRLHVHVRTHGQCWSSTSSIIDQCFVYVKLLCIV